MRGKVWAFSATVLIVLAATDASAQKSKGSTPNGKPFVALQAQIDALEAQVASVEASIDALDAQWREAEARLDEQDATLQELIEADRALQELISALQEKAGTLETRLEDLAVVEAQLAALELEVDEKQAAIIQSCAPGSSIRQISSTGTVACEPDDAGAGGGITFTTTDFSTLNLNVAANSNRVATMFCPSGYRALSGGYTKGTLGTVTADIPDGNGWRVTVVNPSLIDPTFVRVFVRCSVP